MLWVGHFKTISVHFSTNYINNFHKSIVLMNILRCQTHLNLNWIFYLFYKAHFFLSPLIFSFERKNLENLWLINDHFLTVFGHCFANFMNIFHKTEVQTVILRCLVSLNLNWIKSNYIILVKEKIIPCLKMHHFRAISPRWILTPLKEISAIFSKWLFWQNSLMISWTT